MGGSPSSGEETTHDEAARPRSEHPQLAGRHQNLLVDVGCGIGLLTGPLHDLGVDVFGIDVSPGMLAIARHNHPDLRFEGGSMTDLDVPDCSVGGVLAFYSVIHVPDEQIPTVFAHFHRVLRPGGVVVIGFHVGDEYRYRTEGYGYPTKLHIHLRPLDRMTTWLREAGFTVGAQILLSPDDPVPGGVVLARRPARVASLSLCRCTACWEPVTQGLNGLDTGDRKCDEEPQRG